MAAREDLRATLNRRPLGQAPGIATFGSGHEVKERDSATGLNQSNVSHAGQRLTRDSRPQERVEQQDGLIT